MTAASSSSRRAPDAVLSGDPTGSDIPRASDPALVSRGFLRRHPLLLLASFAILATHLYVLWSQPLAAEYWIYCVYALVAALSAAVIARFARHAQGFMFLRWTLFAIYVSFIAVINGIIFSDVFTHLDTGVFDGYMGAVGFTLLLMALTFPSRTNLRIERLIDVAVALVLCALRAAVMIAPEKVFVVVHDRLVFNSLIGWVTFGIALTAFAASPQAERPFFKTVALYFGLYAVGMFCSDQIGVVLLKQPGAGSWSLAHTLCSLLFAWLATVAYDHPRKPHKASSPSLIMQSLLPFTISLLIVVVSILLMPLHRMLGIAGVITGVFAQLTRTVLTHLRLRREAEILALSNTRLEELAHFDALTGLRNRRSFQIALTRALHLLPVQEEDPSTHTAALILLDVDGFKGANDTFGHRHGDNCLVEIALLLRSAVPSPDENTFRLGGDEFAAILTAPDIASILALASDICERIAVLQLHGMDRDLTMSGGVALLLPSLDNNDLLHRADLAMYRAKTQGGNCVALYADDLSAPALTPGQRLRSNPAS